MGKKTTYHHGDLKETILALALQRLEKDGWEELSLRELASLAGVSKTAPYRHFTDKKALLAAMAARGLGELADEMERLLKEPDAKPLLASLGRLYVERALKRPQLFRLMFSSLGRSLESEDCLLQGQRAYAALQIAAARAQAAGYAPGKTPEAAVLQLWSHIHGLTTLLLEGFIERDLLLSPVADEIFFKDF